jgi:crotonobetaine/carnitine-CoA ligase
MTEIGFPITSGWDPPNGRTCGRRREGSPGYEVRIVDEHDEDVPVGTIGELVVRSREPWVMNSGYWNLPELTGAAWRNGWFHTGDAFREDEDGWLYFVDRKKDALRRRGENISSFEVEAGISAHPAVAEVAVIGVPSEYVEDEVKAVVVLHQGQALTEQELVEWLVPRMPRFMIPRYVEFVDALPKTDGTFRVRKVELRETLVTAATWDREAAGVVIPKD